MTSYLAGNGAAMMHRDADPDAENFGGKSLGAERLMTQLAQVERKLDGFEDAVQTETRQRKRAEEERLQETSDALVRLEQALNIEISRRIESHKDLQGLTEQIANEMLTNLQTRFLERIEHLSTSLEELLYRCEALEIATQTLRGDMPDRLQAEAVSLQREVESLSEALRAEQAARRQRDSTIIAQVASLEAAVDTAAAKETACREEQTAALAEEIAQRAREDPAEEKFRQFAMVEIEHLQTEIDAASAARKKSDDDIVHVINRYSDALQRALRSASTD